MKLRNGHIRISILAIGLIFSISASARETPVFSSFHLNNLELTEILSELKAKKNVTFLYEPETIKGVFIITPFSYQDDIKTILKLILPPVGLKFRQVGKRNFVIKKVRKSRKNRKQPTQQVKPPIIKQTIKTPAVQTISGALMNELDREPLIGATVRLKNTNIGTTTNINGQYKLEIPAGKQTLVFSYIGFEDKEIEIIGQTNQNVRLKPSATDFNEIIVTAIGIETNKRLLGYAADNFKTETLSTTNEPNLVSSLSGKSAGVWVNTASGSPGASASIFIRGMRSVNGSNKPLFILDGMPVDNTTTGNGTGGVDVSNRLIDLNSHDIEQISVLKGASATALYGIRAANGAIVMTSKKGEEGKPKVRFSSSFGMSQVNQLPERQNIYSQGKYVNGVATYMPPETNTANSYGVPVSELEYDGDTDYPYDKNGKLVPIGQGNGQPANIYDAYDAFFVNGQTVDNHLAISGGTNWFNYYLSMGQFKEKGVVPRSTFGRYSLKGVFNVKIHETIKLGMSSYLAQSAGYRMKRGSLFSGVPLGLFRNPITFDIGNGLTGNAASSSPSSYMLENGRQRAFRGNGRYDNPFWSINRNPFEDKVNRLVQNLHIDYKPLEWFKASYKIGLDAYNDNRKNAYDINSGTHRKGQINLFHIQSSNINSDFLVSAHKKWNDDIRLEATIGHNFYHSEFSIEETIGEELEKQGVYQISNAIYTSTEQSLLRKQQAGVFADLMLRYKNLLYLNLTGRNDWSSTLPIHNNSFFYPSLNVGFEFSELLNWTNSPILSYGKLRFSVSRVGNDAGTYLTDTYFNSAVVNGDDLLPNVEFPAFGISAFERSGVLGNPVLKPETTTAYEVGVDLRWFKGRINADLTWYKSIHKDQIVNAQLSAASGFLRMPTNGGTIKNEGFEAILNIKPIRKKDFTWNISANFSTFHTLVTDLPSNNSGIVLASFSNISSMIIEGQPYGVFVGNSIKKDAEGRNIIDQDGFPKMNEMHTIIGDPTPDWLMGIQNSLEWKGFHLSALLDIRKGGDIWNGTKGVMSFLGISKESGDLREVTDYVFEGVMENGEINTKGVDFANPANGMQGIYWRRYGFLGLSEAHIEEGSWVRLRDLSLAYHFEQEWNEHSKTDFTISIHGHNVFLITKYSGIDPETNLRGDSNILGWDYFTLPSTKGWSLKVVAVF